MLDGLFGGWIFGSYYDWIARVINSNDRLRNLLTGFGLLLAAAALLGLALLIHEPGPADLSFIPAFFSFIFGVLGAWFVLGGIFKSAGIGCALVLVLPLAAAFLAELVT